MTTRMKFPERRKQRQADATERAERRERRGDEAQLAHLDDFGYRAKKERARLQERIAQATVKP